MAKSHDWSKTAMVPITEITATATVLAAPGFVSFVTIQGNGVNADAKVLLVNASTAVSTPVITTIGPGKGYGHKTFTPPIYMDTGIRLVISGTGGTVSLAYLAE